MAAVLGGLVGFEREWNNHAAGFRTHILVCLGSATIMLLSVYGFSDFVYELNVRVDPARLAAQVVSGIGFLGAGAILRNGNVIKGLTTAASVWVVAAVGLCVGAGFYTGALVCTFLELISLFVLNKWEKTLLKKRRYHEVEIQIADHPGTLGRIATLLDEHGAHIAAIKIISSDITLPDAPERPAMLIRFDLKILKMEPFIAALNQIAAMEDVYSVDAHHLPAFKPSGLAKQNSVSL